MKQASAARSDALFPALSARATAVAGSAFAALALLVSWNIVADGSDRVAIVATLAAAGVLAALAWKDWRFGVFAFFGWFLVEDLVRKFSGNSLAIYAGKDIIYLATLASFAVDAWRRRAPVMRDRIVIPVLALALWGLVKSWDAFLDRPLLPIVGLRMMFLYVPLVYLGFALARERRLWRAFLLFNVGVAALIAILGLLQLWLGLDFLNPADDGGLPLELVHAFSSMESVPRPNSVFMHAGRLASYLFAMLFVACGLLLPGLALPRWAKALSRLGAAIVLGSLVLGGQRTTIPLLALAFAVLAGIFLFSRERVNVPFGKAGVIGGALVAVCASIGALALVSPASFDLVFRFYAWTYSPEALPKLVGSLRYSIDGVALALHDSWWGHGTGTGSLGKQYVYETGFSSPGIFFVEGGSATIAWEWGFVGLLLWASFLAWLMWALLRRFPSLPDRGSRLFGGAVLVYAFSIVGLWFHLSVQAYQNYVTQSILWLLVGAFFAIAPAPARKVAAELPTRLPKDAKRIAIVSPFLDLRHGTERCILEQANRLAALGHEVHVYAQRLDDMPRATRWRRGEGGPHRMFWHPVPRLRTFGALDYAWWFVANRVVRAWDRDVRGLRFDVVLSPGVNCLDADVVVVHIVFREYVERAGSSLALRNNPVSAWPRLLHRRLYYAMIVELERRVYTDPATRIGAVSPLTAREVQRHYGRDDVHVVLNAVDLARFSPELREAARPAARADYGLAQDEIALLLVGNDWKKKGLGTILDAMAALGDPRVRLIVRGRDDTSLYAGLLARLGIADAVRFDPPSRDILPAYAAADVYVGPSVHDSFALPPLEAMACSVPAITSRHNGGACVITDGVDGFVLSDPSDAKALASLLGRLVDDTALRAQVGAAAAERARSLTWAASTEQLLSLMRISRGWN